MTAHAKEQRGGFRLLFIGLGIAAAMFAFGALFQGEATAADDPLKGIKCEGVIAEDKESIFEDAYGFEFGCSEDIQAFTIVSNRQIDSFATEVIGLTPDGEAADGEDFFCIGAVPAFGFGCYGSPGKDPAIKLSGGNRIVGSFTLAKAVCDANVQPNFMGVAMSEYSSVNDLVDPPKVTTWTATSEPFPIDASALRCKVLNPKAKARQICSKVKKAKSKKARAAAKAKCAKARAAAKA